MAALQERVQADNEYFVATVMKKVEKPELRLREPSHRANRPGSWPA